MSVVNLLCGCHVATIFIPVFLFAVIHHPEKETILLLTFHFRFCTLSELWKRKQKKSSLIAVPPAPAHIRRRLPLLRFFPPLTSSAPPKRTIEINQTFTSGRPTVPTTIRKTTPIRDSRPVAFSKRFWKEKIRTSFGQRSPVCLMLSWPKLILLISWPREIKLSLSSSWYFKSSQGLQFLCQSIETLNLSHINQISHKQRERRVRKSLNPWPPRFCHHPRRLHPKSSQEGSKSIFQAKKPTRPTSHQHKHKPDNLP